ncbi:MAG: MOFRL domain-containing protein, hydroxypyruvate reductase [Deltaproteobacteria bacterium CSP1-8]|nr:MAG: MOFRL domain-containing protein, hydroxypyruvate reductase [Deltaproteobacteria bacterium CSP1-8]
MNPLAKKYLERLFQAAVAAVNPDALVRKALRSTDDGLSLQCGGVSATARWNELRNLYVVGGGKAARGMGEAAARVLGERVTAGILAVPRGAGGEDGTIRYIEAGHPIPDEGSRAAAWRIMDLLSWAGEDDLVIALLSGGGSAMLSATPEGVSIGEKERVLRFLFHSGADVGEVNTVRRHLSLVKGGRMAEAASPARVWVLLLSDVPGDDPAVVASGPFSPDKTTYQEALTVLARHGILPKVPDSVRVHLESGAAGKVPETLKPGNPAFGGVTEAVLASNRTALEAAAEAARSDRAAMVRTLPGFLRGEARNCGRAFVSEMGKVSERTSPGQTILLLAGGETTVTVVGKGKGGRCQEFALAAAIALDGVEGMAVLCGTTGGIDGVTDAAGGFAYGNTCVRARTLGFSPRAHLDDNDSYSLLSQIDELLRTGPTGTNVADIAVGVIAPGRQGKR